MGRIADRIREIAGDVRNNAAERQAARQDNRAAGGGVVNRVREGVANVRDRAAQNRQDRADAQAAKEEREADVLAAKVAKKIASNDPRVTKERTRAPVFNRQGVTRDLPRGGAPSGALPRQPLSQRILEGATQRVQDPASVPSSQPATLPSRDRALEQRERGETSFRGEPSNVGLYVGAGVGVVAVVGLLWWALK